MKLAQLGIVGLGVMGANLARNAASKGYAAAVYERDQGLREAFRRESPEFPMAAEPEELPALVGRPRKILLMVRAGAPVDSVLDRLLPVLEPGDVVIDGGNSHWRDTARRVERAEAAGFWYVGAGISGGSRGALLGPSIMPGGSRAAWPLVKELLEALSAKAPDGAPCCGWIGPSGSGHFIKIVHNGIEYGEMQLICEVYQLMRDGLAAARRRGAERLLSDPDMAAGLRAVLPANLLQAQRDCFGAHTYRRVDRPETEVFHTQWTDEV